MRSNDIMQREIRQEFTEMKVSKKREKKVFFQTFLEHGYLSCYCI